jgi:hypothetical protein
MARARQSLRRAKAISIRPRFLESLRLGVAGRFRPLRAGMGTRTPRAFGSSRSQSALASALGPVADTGSIALVAGRPLGGQHLGQEHQRASGVAHRARREEEGEWPAPSVADHVQPGGRAALGAPDRARAAPPFSGLPPCGGPSGARCPSSGCPRLRQAWPGRGRCARTPPGGTTGQSGCETRPVPPTDGRGVLPAQAIAHDEQDPAQHPPIVHARLAPGL